MSYVRGPKVFITYRREETAVHAGRLYDAMAVRYGDENVFMDVEMAPGVDFVERITESVAACQVLIVVMGPRWATLEDEQGRPRLDDPEDFVRLEVETALRRPEVTPIPVLVGGARMPNREDLPQELRAITRRNALDLNDQRWRNDVGRLISTLDELVGEMAASPTAPPAVASSPPAGAKPAPRRTTRRSRLRWVLLGLMAAAAIVVAVIVASGGGSGGTSEETTDYQALLELIPSGIRPRCKESRENASWMVTSDEATAQTLCSDPVNYYLSYGLWRSPRAVQRWVDVARDEGALDCEPSTREAMKLILPGARTRCEDLRKGHEEGPGIAMWWSENGSRVGAWFAQTSRDQAYALRRWERVVTSD